MYGREPAAGPGVEVTLASLQVSLNWPAATYRTDPER